MFKLWATLVKDFRVLSRDKVGMTIMFAMPIVLVVIITSLQSGAFELINENKLELLICNRDKGESSKLFLEGIESSGRFNIIYVQPKTKSEEFRGLLEEHNALIALEIPSSFSATISKKANQISKQALSATATKDTVKSKLEQSVRLIHQPVLQKSYLETINGALSAALDGVQSKQILHNIYYSLNGTSVPKDLEKQILNTKAIIELESTSKDADRMMPNATQHNVPAWTIFAMFFVVTSLGSNVVREKLSGSFVRLKTLPTSFFVSLLSKQVIYVFVGMLQLAIIFSIGVYVFPLIDLPALNMPSHMLSLLLVALVCAWCAVSYAICIGVFSKTQEQANGFGAVSIVILSALGGLLVPGFAMPSTFQQLIVISPLHWCLEAFYDLFLEGGNLKDVLKNVLVIFGFTLLIQAIIIYRLKKTKLI